MNAVLAPRCHAVCHDRSSRQETGALLSLRPMRSSRVKARVGNARQSASGRSLDRRSEKVKPGCPSRAPVSRTSSWMVVVFNIQGPPRSMRKSSSRS